ncbi:hypothetical protein OKA04_01635 [Luteolibacter flavescens]|uniref:Septum formation initiator family protein n=1 Tax=Luteolibacter flavescens TaxID=1859460 RepID=A0ABT3FIM4_9BACT|nr:hypothetical protein [Luteolibacter flavescens]MCW1883410.1 hypothetical protein [Luteolibacter flavescens]
MKRLEAQTRMISTANRIIFAVMGLILGLAVVATALPQQRRLKNLEYKLARTLEAEERVLAEKEYHEIEYRALKDDPEFLELKATDRLNLHQDGGKVYRFKRLPD